MDFIPIFKKSQDQNEEIFMTGNEEGFLTVPKEFIDGAKILRVYDILKNPRWKTFKPFLTKLNATENDLLALEKISDKTCYIYVLDPKYFKDIGIDISNIQSDEIYKELVESLPKGEKLECDHIIQVKSQGRCGPRKILKQALDNINAEDMDILYFKFKESPKLQNCGWFISVMKFDDFKKFIEVEVVDDDN